MHPSKVFDCSRIFSLNFTPGHVQVKAAITSLKLIEDLPMPPDVAWKPEMDMLDWLGGFFGFQVYTMTPIELSLQLLKMNDD